MSESPQKKLKPGQHKGRSFHMSNDFREKIKRSSILNALIEHVEGKREMRGSQVTAGIALLKKVMPDLQNVQHSGDEANPIKHRVITDDMRTAAIVEFFKGAK